MKAGWRGIFSSVGGFPTRIADTSGPFQDFGNSILLNEAGVVGFTASLKSGGEGIFTGPDAVANKVIADGDRLFGSTVDAVGDIPGLNNTGQFAFSYHLTSGTSGVAIASKVAPLGDANGDGSGFDDLLVLAQHYGGPGTLADGDFNNDGNVGFDDLLILAQHYGQGATPANRAQLQLMSNFGRHARAGAGAGAVGDFTPWLRDAGPNPAPARAPPRATGTSRTS